MKVCSLFIASLILGFSLTGCTDTSQPTPHVNGQVTGTSAEEQIQTREQHQWYNPQFTRPSWF